MREIKLYTNRLTFMVGIILQLVFRLPIFQLRECSLGFVKAVLVADHMHLCVSTCLFKPD